jgi:hypothetical protein
MWILPQSLISVYARDTEASTLGLRELSATCAQSLTVRGKQPPSNSFYRAWKTGNLMRLQSGLICDPSRGQSFLTEWTSSLVATPASHSAQQANDLEPKTSDTSGLPSQMEFAFCAPESASSRTSKDTSPLGCEKSLQNWKDSVTARRGEYSARLKLAHRTRESGCSSWPTAAARDWKGTSPGYLFREDGKSRVDQLPVAVDQAEAGNWPTPTVQEAGKIGNQANHGQLALSNHPAIRGEVSREKYQKGKHGPADPANPSTGGSRQESQQDWRTPGASDGEGGIMEMREGTAGKYKLRDHVAHDHKTNGSRQESWPTPDATNANDGVPWEKFHASMMERRAQVKQAVEEGRTKQGSGRSPNLAASVQNPQWATPQSRDNRSGGAERWDDPNRSRNLNDQIATVTKQNAKLNPRWVEALMGLPIGWTMSSCASPVTIEPTSFGCWATESASQPQQELL